MANCSYNHTKYIREKMLTIKTGLFLFYNFLAMLLYPKQLRKVSCFYQKNAQFPEIFGLNC